MSWYVANAILYFRFEDGNQDVIPVWENLYLIEAGSPDEALSKATVRAREDEGDDSASLTYNGRKCSRVCVGIRKVTSCVNEDERPEDGTEVTYNEFQLDSLESLHRLARGEPTMLEYEAAEPPRATLDSPP
jgi:hypothetical protein